MSTCPIEIAHCEHPKAGNVSCGLSFDLDGNLYATDSSNHRKQKFEIDFHE